MPLESVFRSKMLHNIPEEASEDEEEAQPGSSEEDSNELSEDDEDLGAPPQSPKTQLSLFYVRL